MEGHKLTARIQEGFTIVTPSQLGPAELDHLPAYVENLLLQQNQEVVLSLASIETVFSSHLTAFVQVYRLLKSFHLRFVVVDISPAVLNVMQMTQLDSLLPLFLSLDDYLESRKPNKSDPQNPSVAGKLDFQYLTSKEGETLVVTCNGYMSFGPKVRDMQKELDHAHHVALDLSAVGYMDTRVLILVADLARHKSVEIRGASNVLRELFEEHRLDDKVRFVESV